MDTRPDRQRDGIPADCKRVLMRKYVLLFLFSMTVGMALYKFAVPPIVETVVVYSCQYEVDYK
jgi:hypothetical protein